MQSNFGRFCSFSPKYLCIHVGLHCNANEKLTVKRAIAKHKAIQKVESYIGKIRVTKTRDECKMTNWTG